MRLRRLEPVELGHADVHQDDVRTEAVGLLYRLEPVARLGHDVDVLLAGEQHAKAGANHRLVVGDEHTDRHGPSPPTGRRVLSTKPPSVRRPCAHLTAVDLDALADAHEPVPLAVARRAALTVVADLDLQLVRPIAHDHVCVAGVRVLERVGQAFLNDPIGGEVDPAWKRERLPVDVQLDGQPGAADLVQQCVEAVEAGLRHELHFLPFASHRGQEASHLGERRAAGPLHAPERFAVLGERVGELVPDGADLEHHHADGVGDDVVELARDPRALLRDRDARRCLTLALGLDRALLPPPRPARRAHAGRSRRARPPRTGA